MEFRYLGFEQTRVGRAYQFQMLEKGEVPQQYVVTVDLSLFRTHHVGIQEGPTLCAQKLAADLANAAAGDHELTTEDLRQYAQARAAEEERRIEARRNGPRRSNAPSSTQAQSQSPWRKDR